MNGDTEIKIKPVGERECVLKSVRTAAASLELPTYADGRYITEIGGGAFKRCPSLRVLVVPNGVKRIAAKAFAGSDIERIVIPPSVGFIGKQAFKNCVRLNSITIENPSVEAKPHLFAGCYCIMHATVPISVIERGWLDRIEDVTVTGVGIIQEGLFKGCKRLKRVALGEGIDDIRADAFNGCESLSRVELPSGLKYIEPFAFAACPSLESFTVPRGVVELDCDALGGGLKELAAEEGNAVYHSKDNCIIETAKKTLVAGCENSLIPDDGSVTVIGENAFRGCAGLTGIEIPRGVTDIADGAFSQCSELVAVVLPEGVKRVGDFVFDGCTKLESIVFPADLEELGMFVLDGCEWLSDICYNGSAAQWAAVEKDYNWNLTDIDVLHCADGDIEI